MAALPLRFCRSVRSYWPRWGYQRLKNSDADKNLRVAGRPARGGRLQRPIRLRRVSRIRTILSSPIRLLARLRSAYVDSVIRLLGKGSGRSASIGSESLLNRRISGIGRRSSSRCILSDG
ncbi:hypothetical protein KSP40_PGU003530 [Platanthera guangdongensis]|uniref:Uncharacterized protein n=1 Tax=Platanthera guangdongensis TaxID=2320717 RepID=A0ABR2LCW2_9ASPA